jgi:hypothetical protein
MMCFRDKTFCAREDCAKFGNDCNRSLTKQVYRDAKEWWDPTGKKEAPIMSWPITHTPDCFEPSCPKDYVVE